MATLGDLRLIEHLISFDLIYRESRSGGYFLGCSPWKNMEKSAIFPDGYGRIGEIPH